MIFRSSIVKQPGNFAPVASCVVGDLVYSSEGENGIYNDFSSFVEAVKNQTIADCPYQMQGGELNVDNFLVKCETRFMAGFTDQTPAVSCKKRVGSNFYRVDLYEDNAVINFHMDTQDSDGFGMSTFRRYEPYQVYVD